MRSEPAATAPPQPSTDRRSFLGSLALLGYGGTIGPAGSIERDSEMRARDAQATLTVMTRNLYLGVDLSRLFRARSPADVRRIAGHMLEEVERRPFPPRAEAIAEEVAAERPDVVGIQEAALVRTQDPGDFVVGAPPNARTLRIDFLAVLQDALAARGLEYEVAASEVTTDVEVPADADGRTVDVRLTDRDALLVRKGVDVGATRTGTFEASLDVPVEENAVSIERGYCTASVSVDGRDVAVVTTHLESADGRVRLGQAREVLDVLPSEGPVVLAGDVNSGPDGSRGAYDLLIESPDESTGPLADVHATLRPDAAAPTCCQAADLRNDPSRLSRRVDVILSRGLRPIAVERVGADSADRLPVAVEGTPARLWPSDHAGVVATFGVTSSPGATEETPAETPHRERPGPTSTSAATDTPAGSPADRTSSPPLAGFGLVASLLAVVLAAISRRRRGEDGRQP